MQDYKVGYGRVHIMNKGRKEPGPTYERLIQEDAEFENDLKKNIESLSFLSYFSLLWKKIIYRSGS